MLVSIVIPCFNAIDKIGRCMASLEKLDFPEKEYEVLFVDDCSTDGTAEYIQSACDANEYWKFQQLAENSGSPSKPRNRGLDTALGKYIYFLDCDDEILPTALQKLSKLAIETDACVIRSELLSEDGKVRERMNQVSDWNSDLPNNQKAQLIIKNQSTVPTSFVRASLLRKNGIRWAEHLRMGEDTVFLANILASARRIEYLAEPTYVYFKMPSLTPASTQRYGQRELNDHIEVWTTCQSILAPLNINFIESRLPVGLRVAIESLIHRSKRDVDRDTLKKFSDFLNGYWNTIGKFVYTHRIKGVLRAVKENDFQAFSQLTKPRLLIAGHDLKFINDAIPELSESFDIKVDEWRGHTTHDEQKSKILLNWAEYIWCEWLLANAEWYAEHKRPNQKLVVRMHRMELSRKHGENLNWDKVNAVIAVSPLFMERMLERFSSIPRHKARLIYNYVRTNEYEFSSGEEKLFTLGMIGILPAKKGLKEGLEILSELRKVDSRYKLKLFGKSPSELHWIARDPEQMTYYDECEKFIKENNLHDSVEYVGHVNIKRALAEHKVGYILSLSETELGFPGFESFHLAIADGFSSCGVSLIKHWPGAELVWPTQYIKHNTLDIVSLIERFSESKYCYWASEGRSFVKTEYDIEKFIEAIRNLFLEQV